MPKPLRSSRSSRSYRSKFEQRIAKELPAGSQYEAIKLGYQKSANYIPDWILPNGIILEAKGRLTSADRSKMLAVKAAHPELDIRFVFQNSSNPIRKGSKTTYGAWATKHGFPWCESPIPKSWLNIV